MNLTCDNETDYSVDLERLTAEAVFLFDALQLHPDVELSITIISSEEMEALHVEWMEETGATDILSFPMDELRPSDNPEPGMLGDIVICPEYVVSDTPRHGMELAQRIEFLLVHGMLHLIGYDHQTEAEYNEMFARQDVLLERWLLLNPTTGSAHG
jgi:probable rRNA maturation factor